MMSFCPANGQLRNKDPPRLRLFCIDSRPGTCDFTLLDKIRSVKRATYTWDMSLYVKNPQKEQEDIYVVRFTGWF